MKIENQFVYNCSPETLFNAIASHENVTQWWTDQSKKQGDAVEFYWQPHKWKVVMMQTKAVPNDYLEWLCTESNMQDTNAWTGSVLQFSISSNGDGGTNLQFVHDKYKNSPCINECTAGWAFVLGKSLKNFVEIGTGLPFVN